MKEFLTYILESSVICTLFYLFYKTVYYGITYYRWERYFLIFSVLLSFVLPFVKVKHKFVSIPEKMQIVGLDFGSNAESITIETEKTLLKSINAFFNSNIWTAILIILTTIYLVGFALKIAMFIKTIKNINALKKNIVEKLDDVTIYKTNLTNVAFSFFKNIFVNDKFYALSQNEQQTIIIHEKTHIAGYHSVDNIIFNLLNCIHWFNPFERKMAKASREICENIVDANTAAKGNAKLYSQLMLRLTANVSKMVEKKEVKPSYLKKRIMAVFSTDSQKLRKIRFLFSMPILIFAIVAYIMFGGFLTNGLVDKNDNFFLNPNDYNVAARYFENKIFADSLGNVFKVSHRELTLNSLKESDVVAFCKINVKNIDTCDYKNKKNYKITVDVNGYVVEFGGLDCVFVSVGDSLNKGTLMGKVGKNNIPISVKVLANGLPINPENLFYIKQ